MLVDNELDPDYLSKGAIRALTGVLAIYAGCIFGTLFLFSIYHLYLASKNVTTNESLRSKFRGKQNPFDRGSSANLREFLCTPLPASRVFEEVQPMEVIEEPKAPGEEDSYEEDILARPPISENNESRMSNGGLN